MAGVSPATQPPFERGATVPGSTLGVIANPMSGRDIRRLVAHASVFPNAEKTNMVRRILAAAAAAGVQQVLLSTDGMGVAAGVLRSLAGTRVDTLPRLEFVELPEYTLTAQDTRELVTRMRRQGCRIIILLGGDGTVRAASAVSGDAALLPLSTGTNNAFPQMWEATVAGLAAGLLATGAVPQDAASYRAKVLRVTTTTGPDEIALVDACVSAEAHVGSRALWRTDRLLEVFCTFAEPHAVGLSSIAGQLRPVAREAEQGVRVRMAVDGSEEGTTVTAPIAPGVVAEVEVARCELLDPGKAHRLDHPRGTVALDGEREIEFGPQDEVSIELASDGPVIVDVRSTLAVAAEQGLLVHPSAAYTRR